MAVQGVLANRLRSLLTMLGITIGVAAVIVLVAVGNGSSAAVQSRIEALGTNVVTIMPGFSFGRGSGGTQASFTQFTTKDVTALEDKAAAPDIKSVTPVVNGSSVTATFGSASYTPSQFVGTTPSYEEARKSAVEAGSFITPQDESQHARVVVLGETVVENLFGSQNPLGQTIKLNGIGFTVEGVLVPKGTNGIQDQDDIAGSHHRRHRRPQPDHRRGELVARRQRRRGGGDRHPHADALVRRHGELPRPQSGVAAADDRVDEPRVHGPARGGGGDLAARRRDRRDEHHARHRHRADA